MTSNRWASHALAALLALSVAGPALAQSDKMAPIAIPAQPNAIPLNTGPLPGATNKESWHSQYNSVFARNVTEATLTPFLPAPAKATGAAVIVAPGGGFRTLSMQNEGWDVAKALADRGIAAFVLKYRLNQTPADMGEFEKSMAAMFSSVARPAARPNPEEALKGLAPQIADSRAAFALVRQRAGETLGLVELPLALLHRVQRDGHDAGQLFLAQRGQRWADEQVRQERLEPKLTVVFVAVDDIAEEVVRRDRGAGPAELQVKVAAI